MTLSHHQKPFVARILIVLSNERLGARESLQMVGDWHLSRRVFHGVPLMVPSMNGFRSEFAAWEPQNTQEDFEFAELGE